MRKQQESILSLRRYLRHFIHSNCSTLRDFCRPTSSNPRPSIPQNLRYSSLPTLQTPRVSFQRSQMYRLSSSHQVLVGVQHHIPISVVLAE